MSYDVYFMVNTGKKEVDVGSDHNYTYNVSPMFYALFPQEMGIHWLNNKKGEECISVLEEVIQSFRDRFAEMSKFNPTNKWGNAEGALTFLEGILADCKDHPAATVQIH